MVAGRARRPHVRQRGLVPRHALAVEHDDPVDRAQNRPVVGVDPAQDAFLRGRRDESEVLLVARDFDLGEDIGKLAVREQPLLPALQRLPAGVGRQRRRPGLAHGEHLLQVGGGRRERLILGRAELQGAEPLDPRIRLSQHLQAERAHEHEQCRDREERDEQLRADLDRRARDDAREQALQPAERRPPSAGGRRCDHVGLRSHDEAMG